MRVLMLSWEYPPHVVGGLARHTYHVSRALSQQNVDVHVVTLGDQEHPRCARDGGVVVHRTRPQSQEAPDFTTTVMQWNLDFLEETMRILEEEEPFDLIHAHDWLVAPVARSLKHLCQLPLVATIHAAEHGRHGGLHTPQQRYISQLEWGLTYEAWRVILCSRFMQEDLQSFFGLPEEKISVIPNGITVNSHPDYLTLERRKPMILFVGRLVPEKGVGTLLEAMPGVLESCPGAWCVIAGTGPIKDELEAYATQLGVGDRVVFTGHMEDAALTSLYRTARLAVFPSHYEPFGIVALEAMAGGAATIVGNAGGLAEIVEHEVNGVKVEPGQPEALAREVIRVMHEPGSAQPWVDNAYQRLLTRFSWHEIARSTRSVYRQVRMDAKGSWKKPRGLHSLRRASSWTRRMITRSAGKGASS